MARVARKDNTLNDAIEMLDQYYIRASNEVEAALELLAVEQPGGLAWIESETEKCLDLRYYLENYHCISDENGNFRALYPWWTHQEILYEAMQEEWAANGYCKVIVLKPRQTGISVWTAASMFHKTIFTPHSFTMLVAQNPIVATALQKMVFNAYHALPWWLRPEYMYKTKGDSIEFQRKDEKERLVNPGLGSAIVVSHAAKQSGVAIGRCQVPDTVIWTEVGPLTLQQIFDEYAVSEPTEVDEIGEWYALRRPLRVYSSVEGVSVLRDITRVYRQHYKGPMQHCKIEGGVNITKTPQHAILCEDEWKKTVVGGEYVSRLAKIQRSTAEPCLTYPDEAELIGWMLGEGNENKNAIYISQKCDVTRQHIADLIERVAKPKVLKNHPANGTLNKYGDERVGTVYAGCKEFRASLVARGYKWGENWRKKEIPNFIFQANDECIASFLRGFFEAEASVSHVIDIGQMSKGLMEGLRFLLARLGISLRFSTVQKREIRPNRRNYEWTYYRGFIGGPSLRKFYEKVGFISDRKNARLRKTAEKVKGSNCEVEATATRMIRQGALESGTTCKYLSGSYRYTEKQMLTAVSARKALAKLRNNILSPSPHYAFKNWNGEVAAKWADRIEAELNKERTFDRVVEVEVQDYDGMVFDLEVEETHNYTVAGLITHNTIRNGHFSEVSRWPSGEVFHGDIAPTMNAKDTYAVMESTGLGRNGLFYEWWQGSVDGDTGWRPVFIPVYKVKKYYLPIRTRGGIKFELTPEETAFTARVSKEEHFDIPNEFWNFRRQGIRAAKRGDGKAGFLESYPITPAEAFQGSGICAFDAESIEEQQMKYICKPLWAGEIFLNANGMMANLEAIRPVADDEVLSKRKGERPSDRLHIWMQPQKGETYYVSGDVALGVKDGDYSVATVWLAGTGTNPDEMVANWWGHTPPQNFANILVALGYWYNGAEIACEYQQAGITTGDKLVEMDYPALYRERFKDRPGGAFKVYFHFTTNMKTRESIIATMNEALLSHNQRGEPGVIIRCEELIDEMIDFASIGGRMEGQGNHDDGVLSAMIGLYCMRETTTHLKAVPDTQQSSNSGDINVYGIFDNLNRQLGQYGSREEAELVMLGRPASWTVRPILICKANTMYSPIYDGRGAEFELRYKHGLNPQNILPDVVNAYRDAVGSNGFGNRASVIDSGDPDW